MTGTALPDAATNAHIIRSPDGLCAVSLGAVDDLWTLGKPIGRGGLWAGSPVRKGEPSDAYLCAGYDRKTLLLTHEADTTVTFRVEVDICGTGMWHTFEKIVVAQARTEQFEFPAAFQASWLRLVADRDGTATADFVYD